MLLLKVENSPPLHWPVGRVVEVMPGVDGVTQVVTVKTCRGEYKRSAAKVYPLAICE